MEIQKNNFRNNPPLSMINGLLVSQISKKTSGFSLIAQRGNKLRSKKAFSLIEVLFAVLFLVFIGVAMSALNSAATRLITTAEIKVMATSLNEQSLTYVALLKKTEGTNFDSVLKCEEEVTSCVVTKFIDCPNSQTSNNSLSSNCQLSDDEKKTQLGKSRLQFSSKVKFMSADTQMPHVRYLVIATTSWGSGVNRNVIAGQLIE